MDKWIISDWDPLKGSKVYFVNLRLSGVIIQGVFYTEPGGDQPLHPIPSCSLKFLTRAV